MTTGRSPASAGSPRFLGDEDYGYLLDGFGQLLSLEGRIDTHLAATIGDVLNHPGSLVRAQLAFIILRRHQVERSRARQFAVALEYFHSASLIFDDLPAMDDARERRGHQCPHLTFGEGPALLAALALINEAYHLTWDVLADLPGDRRRRAADLLNEALGLRGLLDGQSRDLHFGESTTTDQEVLEIAQRKTVPLIRLTLVLPAMIGGADDEALESLDRLSEVWGLAYQILDDHKDVLPGGSQSGKTADRDATLGRPNLVNQSGVEAASARLKDLLAAARGVLEDFSICHGRWMELERLQLVLEHENQTAVQAYAAARTAAAGESRWAAAS